MRTKPASFWISCPLFVGTIIVSMCLLTACTQSSQYRVVLHRADGTKQEWLTVGNPHPPFLGNSWTFVDSATGMNVQISGNVEVVQTRKDGICFRIGGK